DLQTLRFVANFRWQTPDFAAMYARRVIDRSELSALYAARNFLLQARIALHDLAKRKQDRLNFEYHQELARQFYPSADNAIEGLLSRHYRHARSVVDLMHRLVVRAQEKKPSRARPLGDEFASQDDALVAGDDFPKDPLALFRLFQTAAVN